MARVKDLGEGRMILALTQIEAGTVKRLVQRAASGEFVSPQEEIAAVRILAAWRDAEVEQQLVEETNAKAARWEVLR